MKSYKTTSKHQIKINKDISQVLKKTKQLDKDYIQVLENTLNEWKSEFDEEAYKHLQNN